MTVELSECDWCDGSGVIATTPRDPQQQEIRDCPACGGTGIYREYED